MAGPSAEAAHLDPYRRRCKRSSAQRLSPIASRPARPSPCSTSARTTSSRSRRRARRRSTCPPSGCSTTWPPSPPTSAGLSPSSATAASPRRGWRRSSGCSASTRWSSRAACAAGSRRSRRTLSTSASTGLEVRQVQRPGRGCLSYVLATGGHALVVDPAPDADFYVALAQGLGARIDTVVDTHLHADHLSGARALAHATGATLRLPAGAARARDHLRRPRRAAARRRRHRARRPSRCERSRSPATRPT